MKKYMLCLILFVMLIGIGLAENAKTGNSDSFKQALEADGFTVQEGRLAYFDFMKLYNNGILPSAYGNNPSTKYLVFLVPTAHGHEVSGVLSNIINALGVPIKNLTPFFSLRPDEAVVFVGMTPPECRYFSFDPNLMERTFGNETRWIYASLGIH